LIARLHEPTVVAFPCSGTPGDFRAAIRAAVPRGATVVAHGIGASLALQSGAEAGKWVLLGPVLAGPLDHFHPERCTAPALADADWTVDAAAIHAPVVILAAARDDVAPVEVLVPASRRFPDRVLIRLGLGHLDRRDQDHLGLLTDPIAIAATVRAIAD
jgi:pimeloyl-ACP methyl ester carboxylesterase